jgi:hypothetical protein
MNTGASSSSNNSNLEPITQASGHHRNGPWLFDFAFHQRVNKQQDDGTHH